MEERPVGTYKWWISDLLEFGILMAVILFMAVIYIPRAIWDEEEEVRKEGRFRMENVYDVLSYYQRLTGGSANDALRALRIVNASRDSLTADSTFLGAQTIITGGKKTAVEIYPSYGVAFDTSFGFLRTRKDTLSDTVLSVVVYNEQESTFDTSFVRLEQLGPFLEDTSFVGIADTSMSSHIEVVSYYESYMPDSSMFFCPLTGLPHIIEATEERLKVESPIEGVYSEPRYLVFSFKSDSHGKIEDGEKSWARF